MVNGEEFVSTAATSLIWYSYCEANDLPKQYPKDRPLGEPARRLCLSIYLHLDLHLCGRLPTNERLNKLSERSHSPRFASALAPICFDGVMSGIAGFQSATRDSVTKDLRPRSRCSRGLQGPDQLEGYLDEVNATWRMGQGIPTERRWYRARQDEKCLCSIPIFGKLRVQIDVASEGLGSWSE